MKSIERNSILKKIISYVFVLLAVGGIFYLTIMKLDTTVELSESFRSVLIAVSERLGFDVSAEWWNTSTNIRLIGHVIEYFILGLITGIVIKRKAFGLIICIAISFVDQIVKIYVPARHFDKGDIPFDIIGFCSGLAIAWILKFAAKKIKETELNEG